MKPTLLPSETALLAGFLGLLALALFGPHLAQAANHHAFADGRAFAGVPYAMDVLSNLPFVAWGVAGLALLRRMPSLECLAAQRATAALFFTGLLVTAAGSTWYHLRPDDAGLLIDRLGMVVAFAGLLGLAVADRISARAGMGTALAVLLLGPLAAFVWAWSGNVLPWAVVQFGGMLLVCLLALCAPLESGLTVRLGMVVAIYAAAKLFEMADHPIFDVTGGYISGHSLKHLAAAFAAWPVVSALRVAALNAAAGTGHNRTQSGGGAGLAMKPASHV